MPYVVGQWVRRERFYGRAAQLDAVLRGAGDRVWVVGTRRIGKTSFLREAEDRATEDGSLGLFPLFWDLQGVEDADELGRSFQDALLDAAARLHALGIGSPDPAAGGLPGAVHRLAAALRAQGLSLLLLCDEAEDLAGALARDAGRAGEMLGIFTGEAGVRVVLASSVRFAALAGRTPGGAELLAGLETVFLGGLDPDDARALVRQDHLPGAARPRLDDATVEAVCSPCGGHPFLLQLTAKRFSELGDATAACAQVGADPMVDYLFAADLALLDDGDRQILYALTLPPGLAGVPAEWDEGVRRLEALGMLRRQGSGHLVPGYPLLARWLAARS